MTEQFIEVAHPRDTLECSEADIPDELVEALREAYGDLQDRHKQYSDGDLANEGPNYLSEDEVDGREWATMTGLRHFERILNAIERDIEDD
jgi:hypothetical protein